MNDLRSFLLIFLLIQTLVGIGQNTYEIPVSAKGELKVDVYEASIRVIGITGTEASIRILQEGSGKLASSKVSPNFDVKLEGQQLHIFKKKGTPSGTGLKNILIEVKIPQAYSCDLDTYYGKHLNVRGVQGDIMADNYYGKINIRDSEGRVEANSFEGLVSLEGLKSSAIVHSTEGDIQASFDNIPPGFASIFSSNKGNISISLPSEASLVVGMDTFTGKVESEFTLGIPSGKFSDKKGLNPKLSYRTLNGGFEGSFLTIKNYFGNINLHKKQ